MQKQLTTKIITLVLLSVVGAPMLLPFIWMISTSVTPEQQAMQYDTSIMDTLRPKTLLWSNYTNAWKEISMGRLYLNTLFVAVVTTIAQVFTSSLAGYAFARLNFPGRDKIFVGYLATMMIPSAVIVIPLYILIRKLGMLDSYWALILPAAFTAYGTFMLRQFFMGIPKDLEDAAKIDGCGIMRVYWNVVLPLSKPALATLSMFTFMSNCRQFFWPLIVITSSEKFTLQLGLAKFLSEHNAKWTYLMAGSLMAIIPIILVFLFAQRYFIKGIRLGAVKG